MEIRNPEGAKLLIRHHEGFSPYPYVDTEGYWTCGWGHMLRKDEDHRDAKWSDRKHLEKVFEEDFAVAVADAEKFAGDCWEELPERVQNVAVNMAYNLGYTRMSKFVKARQAMLDRDWQRMGEELMDSRWRRQTGRRVPELVAILLRKR